MSRLTVVIAVWDAHVALLPRCLAALEADGTPHELIVVDNASETPVTPPPGAEYLRLDSRHTAGAARNAGLARVQTEYVLFADADDEVAPGSVSRSMNELDRHRRAAGVIGRSHVREPGKPPRKGIRPTPTILAIGRRVPGASLPLWLTGFRGSLTSIVLRTKHIRGAGGFADLDHGEDWFLAARVARRHPFRWTGDTVRTYHRHPDAASYRDGRLRGREIHRAVLAEMFHPIVNRRATDPSRALHPNERVTP